MKTIIAISILVSAIVFDCSYAIESENVVILNYSDFGPQSMSYKVLGNEWWQWDPHGDSRPEKKYDIKVIVYRNISLMNVKEMHPVIEEKNQDYRYIEYNMAIQHLDELIKVMKEWKESEPDTFLSEWLSVPQHAKEKIENKLKNKEQKINIPIGVATMKEDGTIILTLRAEGENGEVGDAIFSYAPDDMAYFKDPEQAVDLITTMLKSNAWEELSSYYDLSGTNIDKDSLISGDFFIRKKRPEVAHPAGFWRYKEPFSPGFTYLSHETLPNEIVNVVVGIDIDEGDGMVQSGLDSFPLRKLSNGYQLLPKELNPTSPFESIPVDLLEPATPLEEPP